MGLDVILKRRTINTYRCAPIAVRSRDNVLVLTQPLKRKWLIFRSSSTSRSFIAVSIGRQ